MLYLLLLLQPIKDAPDPVIRSAPEEHHYRWVYSNKYADQVHLMDGPPAPNGVQVGTYSYTTDTYYSYDGEKWHKGKFPKDAPFPPKKPPRSEPKTYPAPLPIPERC